MHQFDEYFMSLPITLPLRLLHKCHFMSLCQLSSFLCRDRRQLKINALKSIYPLFNQLCFFTFILVVSCTKFNLTIKSFGPKLLVSKKKTIFSSMSSLGPMPKTKIVSMLGQIVFFHQSKNYSFG